MTKWMQQLFLNSLAASALLNGADTYRYVLTNYAEISSTGISGYDSNQRETKEPGSSAFLQGLEFDEKSDKPCFIRAHWWRYSPESLRQDFTTNFDICKSGADGDKSLVFSYTDSLRQAVNSVKVCSNNANNHRLKGVELGSAYIDKDQSGAAVDSGKSLSFERPNCASWKSVQSCPAGFAAIGLIVEHTADEITGLGLKCTKPIVKSVTPHDDSPMLTNEQYSKLEKDIRVTVDKDGKTDTMTIAAAVARHEVNGATVVVIDQGEVRVVRHYGVRSRKSNLPTNKDTIYQAASTSKFIAAIGMVIAASKSHGPPLNRSAEFAANSNKGSLIDEWVDKQFKSSAVSGYPKDITVERLLSHTAGLDTHGIGTARSNSKTDMENILLGKLLNPGVKPLAAPGTIYDYSGGGFVAAEAMLEMYSGRSATDFLNNEVLKLFGMTKSTFNTANDNMTNLARGCSRGICQDSPEYTTVKFAGGLLANPEEYARLLTVIMNDGKDETGKQILPKADVQRLLTPAAHISSSRKACTSASGCVAGEKCYTSQCIKPIDADGAWYGLGVSLNDDDYQGYPSDVSHGGTQDNARAYIFIDRKDRNGVVIMVNGEYSWTKNGVEYGAAALERDIRDSFFRYFP